MVDVKFENFFDRPHINSKIDAGAKATLSQAGAFVRTRAKRSIRPRKKSAAAGEPPSSHVGTLRDRIFFSYDAQSKSVVIGPKLYRSGKPTGAELLEFGGTTKSWRTGKSVTYKGNPFMRPAMEAEADRFPQLFRGAIK